MKKIMTVLLALGLLAGCSAPNSTKETSSNQEPIQKETTANQPTGGEKLKVMTSIHPVNEIVKIIGGDKVETQLFIKPGVAPHDFEPSPKDLASLQEAKVLFINGLGMEHWAKDDVITKATTIKDLSENTEKIKLTGHEEHEGEEEHDHDHDHEHEHDHDHGEYDPHIWLGLKELKVMAANASRGLSELSPENKATFESNLKKFEEEANALEKEFAAKFKPYAGKSFVTGHEAFGYMCKNLSLKQMGVEGPFAEGEPTPQKLKALTDFVKAEKISTIFLEELASPKVAETLAKETGTKLVPISTLETEGELLKTIKENYTKILESMAN